MTSSSSEATGAIARRRASKPWTLASFIRVMAILSIGRDDENFDNDDWTGGDEHEGNPGLAPLYASFDFEILD